MTERSFQSAPWRAIRPYFAAFDMPLCVILGLLTVFSLVTVYSAGYDFPGRFQGQIRNFITAFFLMWLMANVPPQTLMRFAVPIYSMGIALLLAVAAFGMVKRGARRWLDVGVVIQPSEVEVTAVVWARALLVSEAALEAVQGRAS